MSFTRSKQSPEFAKALQAAVNAAEQVAVRDCPNAVGVVVVLVSRDGDGLGASSGISTQGDPVEVLDFAALTVADYAKRTRAARGLN